MEFPDTAIVRTRVRVSRAGAALLTFVSILVAAGAIGISAQPAAGTPGTSGAFAASAAEQEPDPFSYDEVLTQHRFETSGAGRRRERVAVRVLNQAGVTAFSTLVFRYMAATEQVAIQQLTVEKPDGRKISPPSLTLEDEATGAIDATILDDLRAKRIAVPALEPGDRLTYEVTYTISGSLVPGHFWIDHTFIRNVPVTQETVEIDAPSSRALKVRTRRGQQESSGVAAASGRQVMRWTHRQMRGVETPTTTIQLQALLDDAKQGSDVRVSSFKDWQELASWLAAHVDTKSRPNDAIIARARELTRGIDDPDKQLAALFTFVSTQIRYISLAFGMGRYEPRSAGEVLATQYGDCKDKHVLLASLARAIDLDIQPVLISTALTLDEELPSPSQFDHLISVRTAADPKAWLWMDATSGALPPGALLEPLRDKKAVLVPTPPRVRNAAAGTRTASIVTTPAAPPTATTSTIEIVSTLAVGEVKSRTTRHLRGDLEYLFRSLLKDASRDVRMEMAKEQAKQDNVSAAKITDATYTDAGVGHAIVFAYDTTYPYPLTFDKPWGIWLPAPSLELPAAPEKLDEPFDVAQVDVTMTAKWDVPAVVRAKPPIPVSLTRDFATYSSAYKVEGQTLSLERRLRTTVKSIPAAQIEEYRAFRRAVDADYRQRFPVEAIPRGDVAPTTAAELHSAGFAALQAQQYTKAIDLLERATKLEPNHKYAWNNLGRAYNGVGNYERAITVLKRQIEINPYDEYAYVNLGWSYQRSKRPDEAITAFKKQIEVAPLDKFAHAALGGLHLERKHYDDAVMSYERATSIDPKNASAWNGLGQARLGKGEDDQAVAAFVQAMEASTLPVWPNQAAWALAEKGVKLDLAEQYARKAIDGTTQHLQRVTSDPSALLPLTATVMLPSYWDTLGWVYFKRGEAAKALPWLRAAWILSQTPEMGEHLAMVHEKLGNRVRAIETYAQVVATGTSRPAARAALERLVTASEIELLVALQRNEVTEQRTIKLPPLIPSGEATANVTLTIDSTGRVSPLRYLTGDERLRAPLEALKGLKTIALQPDAQPINFVRHGIVSCAVSGGCNLVLLRPADVRPPGLSIP